MSTTRRRHGKFFLITHCLHLAIDKMLQNNNNETKFCKGLLNLTDKYLKNLGLFRPLTQRRLKPISIKSLPGTKNGNYFAL
jgi:hypothetical protein